MKHATKLLSLLLSVTLLCTLCASLASCGGSTTENGVTVPNGMQAIASEAADYDLIVPSEWLVDTTVGMTSAYMEDRTRSSISVCANEISGKITSADAYWELFSEQFTSTFADFTMLDSEPVSVTVGSAYENNSVEGLKYRYTATVGDTKYQWMQILFIRNATMYIMTYTATADVYESHLDDVNDVIAYFSFR